MRNRKTCVLTALLYLAIPCGLMAAQQKPSVAIIGTGTLAGVLGPAMGKQGYAVAYGSREPARDSVRALVQRTGANASAASQRDAAARAEIIILAVPRQVVHTVTASLGDLDGKIVVDVSRAFRSHAL